MSTRVMAACWPIKTEPSRKAVLIALADQANDDGVCWPSVGTVAERTCLDDRTVQRAIFDLEEDGHLTVERRPGRSTVFRLHPRHDVTPVTASPPSPCHPTPVTVTPHPRHGDTHNRKGTIKEPKKGPLTLPDWLPSELWREWAAYRSGRKGWTRRAQELSLRTLTDLRDNGHDPKRVIEQSIESGWSGLFPLRANPTRTTVVAHPASATPDEAVMRRISERNGGLAVQRLPDGRLKCGVHYYRPNGQQEVAI